MTRTFTQRDRAVAGGLIEEAGTGLYNVVRETGVTCEVCATPLAQGHSYSRCYACNQARGLPHPRADRVGSLFYAIEGNTQVYKIVHDYKAERFATSRLPTLMSAMLALGLRTHYRCAQKVSGVNQLGWTVVPSKKGRTKLRELVLEIGAPAASEVPMRYIGANIQRAIRPEDWEIAATSDALEHVIVVDDSWVTGSNAQGVAAALKMSGVQQVSIFTVARILNPDHGPNTEFIKTRLIGKQLDPWRCPWTGGDCPE